MNVQIGEELLAYLPMTFADELRELKYHKMNESVLFFGRNFEIKVKQALQMSSRQKIVTTLIRHLNSSLLTVGFLSLFLRKGPPPSAPSFLEIGRSEAAGRRELSVVGHNLPLI